MGNGGHETPLGRVGLSWIWPGFGGQLGITVDKGHAGWQGVSVRELSIGNYQLRTGNWGFSQGGRRSFGGVENPAGGGTTGLGEGFVVEEFRLFDPLRSE